MSQVTSHNSVNFFDVPVALQFRNATQQKTIVADGKTNNEVWYKEIGFIADTVLIDPEYWLISKNNTSKKVTDFTQGQNVLQVFPNPAHGRLSIYGKNFGGNQGAVSLFNSTGQLMYKTEMPFYNNAFLLEVSTANYSPGIYVVKVKSGTNTIVVKRVVIQ